MLEAVEVARLLQPYRVAVELIGYADPQSRPVLNQAVAEGLLEWRDFMPNDEALKRLDGALAGLSLLHDEPNYRHSMPTKIVEYMAHGIPVITTPSPRAVELVERYDSGVVVPWQDPKAVAQAVLTAAGRRAERRARARAATRRPARTTTGPTRPSGSSRSLRRGPASSDLAAFMSGRSLRR